MSRRASLGAGLRVLLIDDSEIALEFQSMLLERYGFEVRGIGGLAELDQPDGWRAHVVVTDVDLPDALDGDVIAALRSHALTQGLPVVLCSGLPLEDLERLRSEKQVAGCVSKSENISDLPKLLQSLCQSGSHDGSSTTRQ